MSLFSPLLTIGFSAQGLQSLPALADAIGYPDAHVVPGGFGPAIAALQARTASPDYIIIDIGDHGRDLLPALDDFSQHCETKVRVVVIGKTADAEFYEALRERGVLEYFIAPANPEEVRKTLILGTSGAKAALAGPQGAVISCMSAASGDGASTLAMNLAACLADISRQPVVLVDMDYQFGLISKSLELVTPFGIRELFDHPERGLDQMLISKMLVEYKPNLSIIAAPSDLRLLPAIRPDAVRDLIGILRSQFAYVIIDVPHVWTSWTASTLTYSTHTIMVAQLWLRSLTHAARLLAAWHSVGIDRESVSLVINRSGAKFKEAITTQDFERICHHKINAAIHNDVKAITYAENKAKTLFETDHDSTVKHQILQLAQSLMAQYPIHSTTDGASQNPSLRPRKGLLSRMIKK
jgi:pilus assembly protein CpaE